MLKNVVGTANIAGTFSAGRRPREVLLRVVDCSLNRVLLSSGRVDLVTFMQINPANYQSRPPLSEVVPEAHTDSSVHLTTFALLFCSIELLDLRLIMIVFCSQVHRLVVRHRMSMTGRRTSRPSSRQGPGSGGPPPLVAVIGEYKLSLF